MEYLASKVQLVDLDRGQVHYLSCGYSASFYRRLYIYKCRVVAAQLVKKDQLDQRERLVLKEGMVLLGLVDMPALKAVLELPENLERVVLPGKLEMMVM